MVSKMLFSLRREFETYHVPRLLYCQFFVVVAVDTSGYFDLAFVCEEDLR